MWIGQRLGGWRHQICFPRRFLGHDGSIVNLLDGTQLLSMLGRHICFVMDLCFWPRRPLAPPLVWINGKKDDIMVQYGISLQSDLEAWRLQLPRPAALRPRLHLDAVSGIPITKDVASSATC